MWSEFKEFIMRGSVLDLAVGVVMGSAFTAIVNALVENIITPIITAIVGESEVSDLVFPLGSAQIQYGVFLQAIIDFLIIALILFMVIQGINRLARKKEAEPKMEEVIVTAEEQYLKEIRDLLAEKQIKANDLKGLEDDI